MNVTLVDRAGATVLVLPVRGETLQLLEDVAKTVRCVDESFNIFLK
jgi:hypothetical protein